jgi:hypothetical protein
MRFHTPSFLLGVGVAVGFMSTRARLRPVVVELSALGLHFGRLGRAIVERQWEHAEDLWAEIGERVRDRDEDARERRAAVHEKIGEVRLDGAARPRA